MENICRYLVSEISRRIDFLANEKARFGFWIIEERDKKGMMSRIYHIGIYQIHQSNFPLSPKFVCLFTAFCRIKGSICRCLLIVFLLSFLLQMSVLYLLCTIRSVLHIDFLDKWEMGNCLKGWLEVKKLYLWPESNWNANLKRGKGWRIMIDTIREIHDNTMTRFMK